MFGRPNGPQRQPGSSRTRVRAGTKPLAEQYGSAQRLGQCAALSKTPDFGRKGQTLGQRKDADGDVTKGAQGWAGILKA